jgi:cell cycle sensor histidine kinase DivJ
LVRLHGGELSIRSRVGEGTRVTVRLPLDCERARPARKVAVQQATGTISYLPGHTVPPASGDATREITAPRQAPQNIAVKKSA